MEYSLGPANFKILCHCLCYLSEVLMKQRLSLRFSLHFCSFLSMFQTLIGNNCSSVGPVYQFAFQNLSLSGVLECLAQGNTPPLSRCYDVV